MGDHLQTLTFTTCLFVCFLCILIKESQVSASVQSGSASSRQMWIETNLDKLKKDLLMNYDKFSRPQDHLKTIEVKIGLAVTHLETNELKSTLTVNAWARLLWHDFKLTWNESDYDGISVARVARHEIWQPDLFHFNSQSGGDPITRMTSPNVLIYPNGEVLFVPPIKLISICAFDLRYWPFDTQHCSFEIGSWVHSAKEIDLKLYNNQPSIDIEMQDPSTSWNIINTTAEIKNLYYKGYPEAFPVGVFNMTITRKSDSYKVIVVTPVVVVAVFILAQFWLCPKSNEKLILNGAILIILVTYLAFFSTRVFGVGRRAPLIVVFYCTCLLLTCFSIIVTTIIGYLLQGNETRYLSWLFNKRLRGVLGMLLFLDVANSNRLKDDSDEVSTKLSEKELIFAVAINCILFFVYCIVFLTVGIVYLC